MTGAAFICATDFISIFSYLYCRKTLSFVNSHFSKKCEFLLIFLLKVRVYGTYVILDYLGIIGKTRTFMKNTTFYSHFPKSASFYSFFAKSASLRNLDFFTIIYKIQKIEICGILSLKNITTRKGNSINKAISAITHGKHYVWL